MTEEYSSGMFCQDSYIILVTSYWSISNYEFWVLIKVLTILNCHDNKWSMIEDASIELNYKCIKHTHQSKQL